MAKVKGPLFSIVAIGKIDNKLIYRKRKGIDDVKKYTKTVNPNTPGQQVQKGFFKNAIDAWSIDGYSVADKFAWDQFAKTKKVITSGFNRFTGLKMISEKEGFTWNKLTNCVIYDVTGDGFKVDVNVSSDLSGVLYLGTSKYSMLTEYIGVFSVNKYTFTITGLPDRTKVYFCIKNTSVGEGARTGIYPYYFKAEAVPPVPIDVGNEAINRDAYFPANYTAVDRVNPANANGKITTIEIYVNQAMSNLKLAIFYIVSGNTLSTRGVVNIGTAAVGYHSYPVSLDVVEGDCIGYYCSAGWMERGSGASIGVFFSANNHIPCTDFTFSAGSNYTLSLYGTGETV